MDAVIILLVVAALLVRAWGGFLALLDWADNRRVRRNVRIGPFD